MQNGNPGPYWFGLVWIHLYSLVIILLGAREDGDDLLQKIKFEVYQCSYNFIVTFI